VDGGAGGVLDFGVVDLSRSRVRVRNFESVVGLMMGVVVTVALAWAVSFGIIAGAAGVGVVFARYLSRKLRDRK
jgi:hypothetical protein